MMSLRKKLEQFRLDVIVAVAWAFATKTMHTDFD